MIIAGDFYPNNNIPGQFWAEGIKDYLNNQVSILNLEGPLTEKTKKIKKIGPQLKINPQWLKFIKQCGFDIVSLANNHILDMGEEGLLDTLNYCNLNGIKYLGAGININSAISPLIIEENGVSIGLLAFTENEFSIATQYRAGAAPVDPIENYYNIRQLANCVDKVVILYHGGNELYPFPRPGLQKICRFYVDAGANAVICHHSHTPSGYEIYKDSPIVYGIGNFYFPNTNDEITDWNYGYSVVLNFNFDKPLSFDIIPHYFVKNEVSPLTGEQKEKFLHEIQQKSKIIQDQKLLRLEWEKFVRAKQDLYMYYALSYNRYDRMLFRLKFLKPQFFITKLLLILNYLRCESHHELLINSISRMIESDSVKNG